MGTAAERTGGIDRVGGLSTLDLVAFNGGVNPFNNAFMDNGFSAGEAHYRGIVDHWRMHGFGRIADLGSGYGRWTLFLAEANGEAVGFERNADAVALSSKLAAHYELPNARFQVSDVTAIDAPDASFDAVWAYNVVQFVDRAKLFREAHRILKPGGILFVGIYNSTGRVVEKLFQGYAKGGLAHHTTRFALASLRQGPQFDDGKGTYGSPDLMPEIMDRFGFDMDPTRPLEAEYSRKGKRVAIELGAPLQDLLAFADRFERDPDFAAEMARAPERAFLLPQNVHFGAVRR